RPARACLRRFPATATRSILLGTTPTRRRPTTRPGSSAPTARSFPSRSEGLPSSATRRRSAEAVGAREALRHAAAGGAACAAPGGQIEFGAGAVLAVAPGQPFRG